VTTTARLDPAGLPAVAGALGRAFADDPLRRWLVPDDARRRAVLARFEATVVRCCLRYGEVHVTPDHLGAACWLPPGEPVTVARSVRTGAIALPRLLGVGGALRALAYHRIASAAHAAVMDGPHWYLYLLGVDPEVQGEGRARRLLTPVLDRADAAGLPCYLETQEPGNVARYARFGFAVADRRRVAEGLETFGLRRPPA
jgi:GNAT superfamily N-acetyltransferase